MCSSDLHGNRVGYRLGPKGVQAMEEQGVDKASATRTTGRFAFGCLDWTERRQHLGGVLGRAVTAFPLLPIKGGYGDSEPRDQGSDVAQQPRSLVGRRGTPTLEYLCLLPELGAMGVSYGCGWLLDRPAGLTWRKHQ